MKLKLLLTVLFTLVALSLAACNSQTAELRPVEAEQIENVVKEFVVRNSTIPEYEVTIENVVDGWAKVSLSPAPAEGEPTFLYLHKATEGEAPVADVDEQLGNDGRVTTTTGWNIVLGPGAVFSESELDEVGVPETLR